MVNYLKVINVILLITFLGLFSACVGGHCYDKRTKLNPYMQEMKTQTLLPKRATTAVTHVLAYKYNGSKQCAQGQLVSLAEMQTELKEIEVYNAQVKNDGLMHIMVCGGETGDANVYEIDKKDLSKAEGRGFKVWRFK